jgi:hypothetical protein
MQPKNTGFADRLATAADAKKALLEKFKPKPMVNDPNLESREARRAAELEAVRVQRAAEKEAARAARAIKAEEARKAKLAADLAAIEAKRSAIKTRKAMEKQDAQSRKAARMEIYGRMRTGSGDSSAEYE